MKRTTLAVSFGLAFPLIAGAGGIQGTDKTLETVTVEGNRQQQIGVADSANQGVVTGKQLENRPTARTAEVLEVVPGVIVTQHSGDGKANPWAEVATDGALCNRCETVLDER